VHDLIGGMGLRSVDSHTRSLVPYTSGEDEDSTTLDWNDKPGDAFKELESVEKEILVIQNRISKGLYFLKNLTLDVLYTEFNNATDNLKLIGEALDEADAVMEHMTTTGDMIDEYNKLDKQKKDLEHYLDEINREVQAREAVGERLIQ